MRLADIMQPTVHTVPPDQPAEEAWNLMRLHGIHHLVVMRGSDVVGILSDRDVGSTRGQVLRRGRTVGELMTMEVKNAKPSTTVREAANLMRGRSIGCLPVMEGSKLVGIVTVSDLLELLGRGLERPIATGPRWTMKGRGPRRKPFKAAAKR